MYPYVYLRISINEIGKDLKDFFLLWFFKFSNSSTVYTQLTPTVSSYKALYLPYGHTLGLICWSKFLQIFCPIS
jgi:hypothetical protein